MIHLHFSYYKQIFYINTYYSLFNSLYIHLYQLQFLFIILQ